MESAEAEKPIVIDEYGLSKLFVTLSVGVDIIVNYDVQIVGEGLDGDDLL